MHVHFKDDTIDQKKASELSLFKIGTDWDFSLIW